MPFLKIHIHVFYFKIIYFATKFINKTTAKTKALVNLLPLTGAPSIISYFAIVSFSVYVFGPKGRENDDNMKDNLLQMIT